MDRRGGPYRSPSPGHPIQPGGPYRTPSPGHPIQPGYQLDDNPYGRSQSNLDMPGYGQGHMDPPRFQSPMEQSRLGTPSDNLALNAAVSVLGKAT